MTLLCSFSGTVAGSLSLWNLLCFKGWNKELHRVGWQRGFPGPKPGGSIPCAPELFTDTFLGWCGYSPRGFSQHCWKISSRAEVTPSLGAEFLPAVPGCPVCPHGWVDALLLRAPAHTSAPAWEPGWLQWCRLHFQGKILAAEIDICGSSSNLSMEICILQFFSLLWLEKQAP